MPKMPRLFLVLILLPIILITIPTGCGRTDRPALSEIDESAYQRGKKLLRQGRDQDALIEFLKVIDTRAESPESHLEAGKIYLETLKQPVFAIYHFSKYLEFRPSSTQAPIVRELINTATKEFARSLPGRPFEELSGSDDLIRALEEARAENTRLRRTLAQSERDVTQLQQTITRLREQLGNLVPNQPPIPFNPPSTTTPRGGENTPRDPVPPDTYKVVSGDTLSAISRKVYGTTSRWREIFEANRDILRSPNDLRVGQLLKIPR